MIDPTNLWTDPWVVYPVAVAAIGLLVITVWLFGRRKRSGRQAAVVCLLMSIALHAVIFFAVPLIQNPGGSTNVDPDSDDDPGVSEVNVAVFDADLWTTDVAGDDPSAMIAPLPVAELTDLVETPTAPLDPPIDDAATDVADVAPADPMPPQPAPVPDSLAFESFDAAPRPEDAENPTENTEPSDSINDQPIAMATQALLDDWLNEIDATNDMAAASQIDSTQSIAPEPAVSSAMDTSAASSPDPSKQAAITSSTPSPASAPPPGTSAPASHPTATVSSAISSAPAAMTAGARKADFANRVGSAKQLALQQTGGDQNTEAAVGRALKFLAMHQRSDGGFDSRSAGSGQERRPLGEARSDAHGVVAGSRSDSASTGLALLAMVGSGNTHVEGPYSENVYRGLVYLIRQQKSSGSLAGNATLYASNYCHGMAALAMGEAAAMSSDPNAIEATRRALMYTRSMQHPTTGGFRYTPGDPGDLSQLGWQAMVMDAGFRAGLPADRQAVGGVLRFLRTVRAGRSGGLASYRPGEKPTRTMTAEALATRLLMGDTVPPAEIFEAEQFLLEQPPGVGQDNYYYWYYATIALHQLQDAAWQRWNQALKTRLLATQLPDGSWPTDSVWGGYGGKVYTTAMATLCLEVYYRHSLRGSTTDVAGNAATRR
ncbi:prenyltransferase/squalene oxidase repeat-containing protein [Crateriforma conspicua]|uniref:prenyltransferase/squalene oxidase repeat-containing protein n=1 Tax=Crateriforma conspicua TaxID=2527996 RepID=UPI001189FE69|nr:prenyltransferase/squalene oxidase repeat-containing protein [Crateriforma conspicua]QDV63607.1 hypothetical protein Mal65_27520 [Crateriforma conspicua]